MRLRNGDDFWSWTRCVLNTDNDMNRKWIFIFSRGQFWPPGIVVACICLCARPSFRPSVNNFVCAITHHPFKLGSSNVDQMCKRPWLRSLLFGGWSSTSGQIYLYLPVICIDFCIFEIFVRHAKSLLKCSTSHMAPHICWFPHPRRKGCSMDRKPV